MSERSGQTHCRNCEARLLGEYCYRCGQREGRPDLHFLEAIATTAGGVLNWDSRLWRTLVPLLFQPGRLTRDFIAGRRARYVPPLRLYVTISFFMFLSASLDSSSLFAVEATRTDNATTLEILGSAEEDRGAPLAASPGDPAGPAVELRGLPGGLKSGAPPWLRARFEQMNENLQRLLSEPGGLRRALMRYLPQTMFLMLPFFALLLRAAYLLSPYHYLQHLVFAAHFHSFVYLLVLCSVALAALGVHVGGLLWLVAVLYLPLALRGSYGSGLAPALVKALLLTASYGLVLVLAFVGLFLLALALP